MRMTMRTIALAGALLPCACGSGSTVFDLCTFRLESTEDFTVCGILLDDLDQLTVGQAAQVAAAWAQGDVPVGFTLDIGVRNPNDGITGPLLDLVQVTDLPWDLYLDADEGSGFDTTWVASGEILDPVEVPGDSETVIVPIEVEFDGLTVLEELGPVAFIELMIAVGGVDGDIRDSEHLGRMVLETEPSIDTPFGTMEYPEPVWVGLDWDD